MRFEYCVYIVRRTTLGADFINFGEVSREDAGTYQVTAEDNAGMDAASLTLEIYCENYLLQYCLVEWCTYETYIVV